MIDAQWHISLEADCPHCGHLVDLMEYEDFWDSRQMEFGETKTDETTNMDVVCPICFGEFVVNCTY